MEMREVLERLRVSGNPAVLEGMARFGIRTRDAYGVPVPALRRMAGEIGRDHGLALELWKSGIHEARLLACFIDDPGQVTGEQMERWAGDFDSWDLCDQACVSLFERAFPAPRKAVEWSSRREMFVKRAGFVLMAALAVHDKDACDEPFRKFLAIIKRESGDDRRPVRKAVKWALREIGKRGPALNREAVKAARDIQRSGHGRWVGTQALRELTGYRPRRRPSRN